MHFTIEYIETVASWDVDATKGLCGLLSAGPLDLANDSIPEGLRAFVCRAWVEEIHKAVKKRVPRSILPVLLEPCLVYLGQSQNHKLAIKTEEEFYDAAIEAKSSISLKTLAALYFEYGSRPSTHAPQREVFYKRYTSILEPTVE
jgi:hypothetical protein